MLLQVEAIGLVGLAIALAIPVPNALSRARWTARAPGAALVLWQAVGLGGGLSILGAGLTLAVGSESEHWLHGVAALPRAWARLGPAGWVGVAITAAFGAWLIAVAVVSTVRVILARRVHRRRLDVVAETFPTPVSGGERPPRRIRRVAVLDIRLVEYPQAIAYCLPGLRPRVVVSRGTLNTLDLDELAAVLAHERAHARGRHDLLMQPFLAWRETFPFLKAAGRAVASVELLIEMLADDAARRSCATADLRNALHHLKLEHRVQTGHDDPYLDIQLAARTARLHSQPTPLPAVVLSAVYAAAVALTIVPPLVLALT
ncbi:MAG: M56 family peptidase [Microbacteriaceae bacterium]|nr:MAG: M56 family peptidase [Microbacteriaceae bacterium]